MATPPRVPDRVRAKINDCLDTNRVTIVVGPTGSGKSTQIPAALLEDTKGGPILCSQPRRLAVVAVATRVAEERQLGALGTTIGYHVGQSNHSTPSGGGQITKLLFVTAGILLQDLRMNGIAALTAYKVVVIDECHERSPESDLVLVLIKSLMQKYPTKKIRIILMSATFDHSRYRQYFEGVPGCATIDTIHLESAQSFVSYYEKVETFYLESTIQKLPLVDDALKRWGKEMQKDPHRELIGKDAGKTLSHDLLRLLRSLIGFLHTSQPMDGVFLIFAPTYRHLEQILEILRIMPPDNDNGGGWKVGVLHSAVDMEFCMKSMQQAQTGDQDNRRKILLASAIADSSVTIPGVTCIVDLCRALEVRWDMSKRTYQPRTVWASKSICEQRKGRTGRTCAGQVFRLVPQSFYINKMEHWDVPQLYISSSRDESLKLLCMASAGDSTKKTSNSTSILDPARILSACLDPPPQNVVQDSLHYLKSIGACIESSNANVMPMSTRRKKQPPSRLVPTFFGQMLASLPFKVEDSTVIVRGGQLGVFYETLAYRAIHSHKPSPIVHHFGKPRLNNELLVMYYPGVDEKDVNSVNLAHLSAFFFWDAVWNGSRAHASLSQFSRLSRKNAGGLDALKTTVEDAFSNEIQSSDAPCCDTMKWTPELEEKHIAWCQEFSLNPTAVRAIADMIDTTCQTIFMEDFLPEWLQSCDPLPKWRSNHHGNNASGVLTPRMLTNTYGEKDHVMTELLKSLAATASDGSRYETRKRLADEYHGLGSSSSSSKSPFSVAALSTPTTKPVCIHFLQGNCRFGTRCRLSHSATSNKRPPCRFYQSGHCKWGDQCIYSHDLDEILDAMLLGEDEEEQPDPLTAVVPLLPHLKLGNLKEWIQSVHGKLLLLGEGSFEFTNSLVASGLSPAYATTKEMVGPPSVRMPIGTVFALDATRVHLHPTVQGLVREDRIDTFYWNFPYAAVAGGSSDQSDDDNDNAKHASLILGTFLSLKVLLHQASGRTNNPSFTFGISLQADQFSRWNLLSVAWRSHWRLVKWGPLVVDDFAGYTPRTAGGSAFSKRMTNPRVYLFQTTRTAVPDPVRVVHDDDNSRLDSFGEASTTSTSAFDAWLSGQHQLAGRPVPASTLPRA